MLPMMRREVRLSAISIYPVKAFRGLDLQNSVVEPWGLEHDRRWMVVDDRGRFLSQREDPTMALISASIEREGLRLRGSDNHGLHIAEPEQDAPVVEVSIWKDRVRARRASPEADTWLTQRFGRPVSLVFMADPARDRAVDPDYARPEDHVSFADGFPLLITSRASLDDLNIRLASPLPMDRFRPNLVVEGTEPWDEDTWTRIRVGTAEFATPKLCARCAVTTVDQQTGLRSEDREPLRTLQTFRRGDNGQVTFGQNLVPLGRAPVHVGDPVEVLTRRS